MIIAIYSLKGGVGKTTLAVNLAWASATISARKTLLWDLDAQAAASWILGQDGGARIAQSAITKEVDPAKLIQPTAIPRLDLLPADESLRNLDLAFHEIDKKKRLAKIAQGLTKKYDRVIIDCPPGLTDTSEQILRAADLVVVPVIPSALSTRALETVREFVEGKKGPKVALLPVYSMVDRRRVAHRSALEEQPNWPVVPMASAFEAMAERRKPLGAYTGARTPAVQAVAGLWTQVERALGKTK